MNDCGRHLVELPHDLPVGYPFVCACCQRVWELRDRTFLGRLAFWRHTEPARDKLRVWVRLSKFASLLQQSIQERG